MAVILRQTGSKPDGARVARRVALRPLYARDPGSRSAAFGLGLPSALVTPSPKPGGFKDDEKPLTVAFALALAFQLSLPAIGQTTDLTVATAYPGLTVEPGDTAGFDLVITAPTNTTWLWP